MATISKIRTPLFICIALIVSLLVIGVETGNSYRATGNIFEELGGRFSEIKEAFESFGQSGANETNANISGISKLEECLAAESEDAPGYGIASLQYVDCLLLFSIFMVALPLVAKAEIVAKLQGVLTVIISLITLVFGFLFILKVVAMLFLMTSLMLAIPFGTITYMVLYGSFETGEAAAIMSTLMTLKIAIAVLLLLAHEQFLKNLGLILLIGTSLITMVILGFLHNFLPIFLVNITDAIGALINVIIALLWSIILLFSGLAGVIKVIVGLKDDLR